LRQASGATIPEYEIEKDKKMCFPQPGDDAAALEQKKNARKIILEGILMQADPYYQAVKQKEFGISPIGGDQTASNQNADPLGLGI
jgi:hypothetical protein